MTTSWPKDEIGRLNWRKALRSVNNGACAEVASTARTVVVRDSTDPSGPMLAYSVESWRVFAREARLGGFDTVKS
jgi:Domain of unknown function (DUF397)